MANPYARCGRCKGNMWPPGQMNDHPHLEDPTVLKKRLRTKPHGWSRAAPPRTNSPKGKVRTVVPRKRAYGPF